MTNHQEKLVQQLGTLSDNERHTILANMHANGYTPFDPLTHETNDEDYSGWHGPDGQPLEDEELQEAMVKTARTKGFLS